MSEPTAPSADPRDGLDEHPVPPPADIFADVDPSIPRYAPGDPSPDEDGPFGEPSDAGGNC